MQPLRATYPFIWLCQEKLYEGIKFNVKDSHCSGGDFKCYENKRNKEAVRFKESVNKLWTNVHRGWMFASTGWSPNELGLFKFIRMSGSHRTAKCGDMVLEISRGNVSQSEFSSLLILFGSQQSESDNRLEKQNHWWRPQNVGGYVLTVLKHWKIMLHKKQPPCKQWQEKRSWQCMFWRAYLQQRKKLRCNALISENAWRGLEVWWILQKVLSFWVLKLREGWGER